MKLNVRRSLVKICALLAVLLLPAVAEAQFNFTTNTDGSLTINQYTASGRSVVIPATTNGLPITAIGNSVFFNNGSFITSVTIGANVTNIGSSAFSGCSFLTNLVIPNGVITIGNYAFNNCHGLKNLVIGTNVTTIGTSAFLNCASLTNIIIPDSVISLGDSAVGGCNFLAHVKISNSITNTGQYVFASCYPLNNVISPDSVATIGWAAFSGDTSLSNVKFGAGVITIQTYAFDGTALTSVTIPDSVTSIGYQAFDADYLAKVTIGSGVTNIYGNAFSPCYNLTSAYFRGNAPTADATVFQNNTNVIVYYLPGTTGWGPTFAGRPTVLWNPQAQTDGSFGVQNNKFGFNITGSSNLVIVVEACTNFTNPTWKPVATNTLNTFVGTNGTSYFSDPQWTNNPAAFYRLRSP